MYLGVEIGGTKTQLGVGQGEAAQLEELLRYDVDPAAGAEGILANVQRGIAELRSRFSVEAIGVGFGGPVDAAAGMTIASHQIDGWEQIDLRQRLGEGNLPVVVGNDCDVAALAEARWGAGSSRRVVQYVTVGTGIGGGLVVDGRIHRGFGLGAAEIGHLRPGLRATSPEDTVESVASGWGLVAELRARLGATASHRFSSIAGGRRPQSREDVLQRMLEVKAADERHVAEILKLCGGDLKNATGETLGAAASAGNPLAMEVLSHGVTTLGWAIAQCITLLAPEVVVVGGGVSQMGEELFFEPLRAAVAEYVFPPFVGRTALLPAALGAEVVVHGALALASMGEVEAA